MEGRRHQGAAGPNGIARHYVVTRSIFGPDTPITVNRARLVLMRGVTARSLRTQTSRAFVWVVAVHRRDPLLNVRRQIVRQIGGRVVVVEPPPHLTPAEIAWWAYRHVDWPGQAGDLVTRLDDDDALARSAIARIQRTKGDGLFLFPRGVRIWRGRMSRVRHERNAMSTLRIATDGPRSVYDFAHVFAADFVRVSFIDENIGWLWLRHATTLSGHRPETDLIVSDSIKRLFGVNWAMLGPSARRGD